MPDKQVGEQRYPKARELFITADAGGSNSYRSHVWKHRLQQLADKLDLAIHVSHCRSDGERSTCSFEGL